MSLIETCLVLTRGSEQIEGGTAFPRRGAMTVPDHVLQIALQVPKRDQSLADLGQLVLGQQPRLLARALTLDLQQSSHFVPTESDRKSVVSGKSVSVRLALGGRRIIQHKTQRHTPANCNRSGYIWRISVEPVPL